MSKQQDSGNAPLYAVIDLGSNSFHMLIARLLADSVQIVDKVKRKVRLASGLDENNMLTPAAMARGWECLSFFAERLQDIPDGNIRVVATATLRIANNADQFLAKAQRILGQPVKLLSGDEEAEQIYLGVAHTNCSADRRLIIDIGGASTEIIVGEGFQTQQVCSLHMGCVTFNQYFFADGQLNEQNFKQAIGKAKQLIAPWLKKYQNHHWESALGGSGTMQALGEILQAENKPAIITLEFLQQIQQRLLACGTLAKLQLHGLTSERKPVFASGVAILLALFQSFDIKQLQLSSGAIREGLLYEMLPNMRAITIRQRTVNSLSERFHIDKQHAKRVLQQAENLFQQLSADWQLTEDNSYQLMKASCQLHEVGLLLEYKYHQQHGAYILQHADLPGFDQSDRQLLVALVWLYKGDIDHNLLQQQRATDADHATRLLMILRLAVILCRRRQDDVLPAVKVSGNEASITLCLPADWLAAHPLIADELSQEHQALQPLGLSLNICH